MPTTEIQEKIREIRKIMKTFTSEEVIKILLESMGIGDIDGEVNVTWVFNTSAKDNKVIIEIVN